MNTATYTFEKIDACTGNLASSVRTIPIASVPFLSTGILSANTMVTTQHTV
jgi:hypothetical protein